MPNARRFNLNTIELGMVETESMNTTEGYFQGHDRCQLYYQLFLPEEAAWAGLIFVHGIREHIGRYGYLYKGLVKAGLAVLGYDQRGHGRSAGRRGHIDTWEDYRGDLHAALGQVASLLPGLPVFLYGHSMGTLVVLDYLIENPDCARGAILSGAAIDPVGVGTPQQIVLAKMLSRLWPTFQIKVDQEFSSKLSHDPEVVQGYDQDPLVFDAVTARWGVESLKTVERIKANPQAIQLPVLFIHGSDDPINSAQGTQTYFEQIASLEKRLVVYPDCLHEPHNEQMLRELVVRDITRWVDEVLEAQRV